MIDCRRLDWRKVIIRDHTKLRAFELADEVVLLVYKTTRKFPKEEIYGFTSQIRKANAQRLTACSPWPRPDI